MAWVTLSHLRHFFHISTIPYTIGLNKNTIAILLNICKWRLWVASTVCSLSQFGTTSPFSVLLLSQSLTSSSTLNFRNWGSLVLIRLLNKNCAGLIPVVEWGVPSVHFWSPITTFCCVSGYCSFVFQSPHLPVAIRVWFAGAQFSFPVWSKTLLVLRWRHRPTHPILRYCLVMGPERPNSKEFKNA